MRVNLFKVKFTTMISGPSCFCLEKISYAIAEENKFSYCTQLHVIKTSFKHNIYSKAKVKKKIPTIKKLKLYSEHLKKNLKFIYFTHKKGIKSERTGSFQTEK